MNPKLSDPVIDEIREVRHRISERFNHDSERIVAYYLKLQEQYQNRLVKVERVDQPEQADPSTNSS
jgi:hypothetical protein